MIVILIKGRGAAQNVGWVGEGAYYSWGSPDTIVVVTIFLIHNCFSLIKVIILHFKNVLSDRTKFKHGILNLSLLANECQFNQIYNWTCLCFTSHATCRLMPFFTTPTNRKVSFSPPPPSNIKLKEMLCFMGQNPLPSSMKLVYSCNWRGGETSFLPS